MLLPSNFEICELHGYSDASEKGYAAVIYFRTQYNNIYQTFLLQPNQKLHHSKEYINTSRSCFTFRFNLFYSKHISK